MENKFTDEILNGYENLEIKSEVTFEYEKGYIKMDDVEIAEFDKLEINIQPIFRNASILNSNGDNKRVMGYEIKASLNISRKYSRYNEMNAHSRLDIEVSEEIIISKCNIRDNMILQNIHMENIEII